MKKVLVTGAAGFIGSNLVDELVRRGTQVVAVDDLSVGKVDNLREAMASGQVHFVERSILQPLGSLLDGVSVVYHLAVACLRVCFDRPHHVHEVNATGTLNLLEECRQRGGLERFVYCSSSEVYGTALTAPMDEEHPLKPTTVYGGSKLAGELYTHAYYLTYKMPTVIVRPFNTYGYREHHEGASGEVIPRFLVRILNGRAPIIFGDGSQTRDFTFVTDTVRGILECAKLTGTAVNVARGQEVSIAEIARLLLELTGRTDLQPEYQGERPADVHRHYASVAKAHQNCGFKAEIGIREGLQMYIDWFRKHYPDPSLLMQDMQEKNWAMA